MNCNIIASPNVVPKMWSIIYDIFNHSSQIWLQVIKPNILSGFHQKSKSLTKTSLLQFLVSPSSLKRQKLESGVHSILRIMIIERY